MSNTVKLAVVQMAMSPEREANLKKAGDFVRQAAKLGAQIVLLPELVETHYFCRVKDKAFLSWARPIKDNQAVAFFRQLAKDHNIALPVPFFEVDNQRYFNSIAFIDEQGRLQGVYRKTFIPSGPGYEEKFYFEPGDSGYKVWETGYGRVGVGICWDQWFPEPAREMTLMGADVLLYPTCIGSEPLPPHLNTQPMWQRAMTGHTVSNVIPVAAANRVGTEGDQTYYGTSFIASHRGEILVQADRLQETVIAADLDFEQIRRDREDFGLIADIQAHRSRQK